MQTADFYSSATGTLRVNGGRDENAPQGVSLSIDDLSYIKQGSRANDAGSVTDYDLLDNKPQINNITLTGNKSLNDLGIQPKIDSSHKVSADNINDTGTTNKFATAAQLAQISTNENNISSIMDKIDEIGIVKTISPITPSAANTYECITASKITLPAGKILRITAACIFQNSYATGIAIVRGTTKADNKTLAISESTTDYNALSVSTVCSFGTDQDIYVFLKTNSTGTIKVVMVYDIIAS